MKTVALASLLLIPGIASGYSYYFTDTFTSINSANWHPTNGSLTASNGLTSSAVNGGSIISKIDRTAQNPDYRYEVRTGFTLSGSGGTYVQYLRATTNALLGPTSQGTYYAVEMQDPAFDGSGNCAATLTLWKRQNNALSPLVSKPIGCWSGMDIRTVFWLDGNIVVYVGDVYVMNAYDSSIASGQPGVGVRNAPSGNKISIAHFGDLDRIAPGAVNAQSVGSTAFPSSIDLQWQGVVDDNVGFFLYEIYRNGVHWNSFPTAEATDRAVVANTQYNYTITARDFHGNGSVPTPITVQTPVASAMNPRQVGVRPNGTYWGAAGEQIDMRAGKSEFHAAAPQTAEPRRVGRPLRAEQQQPELAQGRRWNLETRP